MKLSLKKSILLLGVAIGFVFTAWAFDKDKNQNEPGWFDRGSTIPWRSLHGVFRELDSTPTEVYGYCICDPGYFGYRCEWEIDAPME